MRVNASVREVSRGLERQGESERERMRQVGNTACWPWINVSRQCISELLEKQIIINERHQEQNKHHYRRQHLCIANTLDSQRGQISSQHSLPAIPKKFKDGCTERACLKKMHPKKFVALGYRHCWIPGNVGHSGGRSRPQMTAWCRFQPVTEQYMLHIEGCGHVYWPGKERSVKFPKCLSAFISSAFAFDNRRIKR